MLSSLLLAASLAAPVDAPTPPPAWSFRATIIEACSCPMFCQCYFNPEPAKRGPGCCDDEDGKFCRFNNAFRVDEGRHGDVDLAGAKFWVAGDLGGDFSEGQMDWATCVFDEATSEAQRAAIVEILGHVYPVEWASFETDEGSIEWKATADEAVALLDGGEGAEVRLKRFPGMTEEPVVIHNLPYWGAPRNEGFVLMPNEIEAYRRGPKPFEFRGTNGFMITIAIDANDVAAAESREASAGY